MKQGASMVDDLPPGNTADDPGGLDHAGLRHLLGYQLAQANLPSREVFSRHIGRPMKLRPVEFSMLMLLAHNPGASPKQLRQALAVSAPNLTVLLDRVEQRGWIQRQKSETDGRAQNVYLTQAGTELARRAYEASTTMESELLKRLSDGERAMLRELLAKVSRR